MGRFLPMLVATFMGLCSTGLVFYFSSQRAAYDTLQAQVSANTTSIALITRTMELNKARRDDQMNEIVARLDAGRRR